jgi:hypothetical protein
VEIFCCALSFFSLFLFLYTLSSILLIFCVLPSLPPIKIFSEIMMRVLFVLTFEILLFIIPWCIHMYVSLCIYSRCTYNIHVSLWKKFSVLCLIFWWEITRNIYIYIKYIRVLFLWPQKSLICFFNATLSSGFGIDISCVLNGRRRRLSKNPEVKINVELIWIFPGCTLMN